MMDQIKDAVEAIRKITDQKPKLLLVLGSGLADFGEEIKDSIKIPYKNIPHFVTTTAHGHPGNLIFGKVGEVDVLCMQGRFHAYEGYDLSHVVFPIRVARALGADIIFLTNAAGGINPQYKVGDFMIIEDHIKLSSLSPLTGREITQLGPRFVNMTGAYDEALRKHMTEAATKCNIKLQQGVYAYMAGPQFETPAEIKALSLLGADAVGMSTVFECIVARSLEMKVLGISCITNAAAKEGVDVTAEEVNETTHRVKPIFNTLMTEIIATLPL